MYRKNVTTDHCEKINFVFADDLSSARGQSSDLSSARGQSSERLTVDECRSHASCSVLDYNAIFSRMLAQIRYK